MTTFSKAFANFWKGYVDFTGRSTRAEYWWTQLWQGLVYVIGLVLMLMLGVGQLLMQGAKHASLSAGIHSGSASIQILHNVQNFPVNSLLIGGVLALFFLVTLVPNMALATRRYRDTGLSFGMALAITITVIASRVILPDSGVLFLKSLANAITFAAFLLTVFETNALKTLTN